MRTGYARGLFLLGTADLGVSRNQAGGHDPVRQPSREAWVGPGLPTSWVFSGPQGHSTASP